jgi:hypothetical protein
MRICLLTDELNILEWLNAPVAAFLCDAGLWGNIPESMKEGAEQ